MVLIGSNMVRIGEKSKLILENSKIMQIFIGIELKDTSFLWVVNVIFEKMKLQCLNRYFV